MIDDPKLENFGQVIQSLRKLHNLSVEQLAAKLGISQSTLTKYENGDLNVRLSLIREIAHTLDERPDAVLIYGLQQVFPQDFQEGSSLGKAIRAFAARIAELGTTQ